MLPIYLDYNATTPIHPAVVGALVPYLTTHYGNPSSSHAFGKTAHVAVAAARVQVAALIGASPDEIIFTGGGTEASNLAIKGLILPRLLAGGPGLRLGRQKAAHVITSVVEHPATLQPCAYLERLGCRITRLPVDRFGVVDLDAMKRALGEPTDLVSIMHSNNEVGTLQPIAALARLARERGALVHTDAAQSLGKLLVNVDELGVDLLTIAGHKLYAPKGVGVLYVRRGIQLEPLIHGAGHETGRRAGTENVPYLVGLGVACDLAAKSLPAATDRLRSLRDRLWHGLSAKLGERIVLNGHPTERLPNTLNVSFLGRIGAELLAATPRVAASTGSACHEGQVHVSPVLKAMGVSEEVGKGAVRLSVGRFTTEAEVDEAVGLLAAGGAA
jgi:cysteine desulfurase